MQIVRLCLDENIPLINIVRSDESASKLKLIGAKHVLNQTDEDFLLKLKSLSNELEATVCLECVAGDLTG